MASSLILHKRITTTTAKAKALRTFVEPLITKSKEDSTHSRRVVFSYLKDKTAVAELFRDISPKVGERPGGYTRILKIGNRIGDNADMCILELVDYNEAMLGGEAAKTKTTRRRRTTKKKEEVGAVTKAPKAAKEKTEKSKTPVTKVEETKEETAPEE
jgi:large subunit ribosomal protein L17